MPYIYPSSLTDGGGSAADIGTFARSVNQVKAADGNITLTGADIPLSASESTTLQAAVKNAARGGEKLWTGSLEAGNTAQMPGIEKYCLLIAYAAPFVMTLVRVPQGSLTMGMAARFSGASGNLQTAHVVMTISGTAVTLTEGSRMMHSVNGTHSTIGPLKMTAVYGLA